MSFNKKTQLYEHEIPAFAIICIGIIIGMLFLTLLLNMNGTNYLSQETGKEICMNITNNQSTSFSITGSGDLICYHKEPVKNITIEHIIIK